MTDPLHGSIFGDESNEPTSATRSVPRDPAGASARRRRRKRKPIVMLLAMLLVAGAAFGAYQILAPIVRQATAANDYPGPGTGTVDVTIEQGSSGRTIARALLKAGVVKSTDAYLDAAGENDKAASVQPGVYTLAKQMKASDAVAALTDGKHRAASVVITPGMRSSQAFVALSKGTKRPVAEYESAARNAAAIGLPDDAGGNIEGYLAPGSYDFPRKATATDQLRRLVSEQKAQLAALGVPADRIPHVLTVGSLVEKEAGAQDFAKVARVIENRLSAGMPLQLDSTVNYIQNKSHIATTDRARASDSPYNTYRVKGLPPGPISSPGPDALKAAANPAPGSWLYFVTVDPCTHQTLFATSYSQHQQNVQQFQNWLRGHPGQSCS